METVFSIQNEIKKILKEKIKLSIREAKLETLYILEHTLKMKHSELICNQFSKISKNDKNAIHKILAERIKYKPLAYIFGEWDFYGCKFFINNKTLIPRQDTELIIDLIYKKFSNKSIKILDLGTGSGIIGITLAKILPKSNVLLTDISFKALEVAKKNINNFDLKNIKIKQSNWFKNLTTQKFDLIISNPPYISQKSSYLDNPELTYEPKIALTSKENGLADIIHIIEKSPKFLKKGGEIYLEHGYNQSKKINDLLKNNLFTELNQYYDLNKIIRVTSGKI